MGGGRDHRIGVPAQPIKRLEQFRPPRVADRPGDVAQKARILGPPNRRMAERGPKVLFGEGGKRRETRFVEHGVKGRLGCLRRAPVPGADILANIAPEQMIGGLPGKRRIGRSPLLNREIRNAQPRIDLPLPVLAGDDRLRRTSFNAACAGAAASRGGQVGNQRNREQKFAEKEPGALPLIDQAGIAPDPTKASLAGIGALEERRGVDTGAVLERLPMFLGDPASQIHQRLTEHVMVIDASGVPRDLALGAGGVPGADVVQLADADHGFGGGQQVPRIASEIAPAVGEIGHLARHSRVTPLVVTSEVLRRNGRSNPNQFEAAGEGELFNPVGSDGRLQALLPSGFILTPPILAFHNVYVQRGSFMALNGLSLQIEQGEHVAILGPNGSGKSTLIKTITRECYPLLRPETRLAIMGQASWNIFDLRAHLGVVSNDLMARCTRDITGREVVLSGFFGSIGVWPNHVVTEAMEIATREALERLEAGHLAGRWLDELSSGEARRLLIARALIHQPSTLLLDEPTTSLDLPALREVRTYLRSLAAGGVGLLLVTHHLDDIIPEIERVVLLREGAVLKDGPKAEVLNSRILSDAFEAPLEVFERDGYYHAW